MRLSGVKHISGESRRRLTQWLGCGRQSANWEVGKKETRQVGEDES